MLVKNQEVVMIRILKEVNTVRKKKMMTKLDMRTNNSISIKNFQSWSTTI
jgi:hypothetical protein